MRIGVDVGGTKIEVVALADSGDVLDRRRAPTPGGDYQGIIAAIAGLIDASEAAVGPARSVGLGTPGVISPSTGLMKNANSVVLNGNRFDVDLAAALGRPIRMANDADCLALSEASDGAGAGASPVFAVILGTGVGGGLVVDGRLVTGPSGIAGEWGHNELPYLVDEEVEPLSCYCGRRGCVETYLSGPGLEADHLRVEGVRATAADIATAMEAGDASATRTMVRYADRLARGLSTVMNIVDPETIVLGGGVSNIDWLYGRVPELWDAYVFTDSVETKLVKNVHGDSSGVRGAAWLWPLPESETQ